MSEVSDVPLQLTDERTALAVVTSAFIDDPVERWLYPDERYHEAFPQFVHALGGRAIEEHTAWRGDSEHAVALWLPPGVTPDDDMVIDVLTSTVETTKHEDMFAVLEQMADAHPSDPHWYLAWLAVDQSAQGHGLGDDLLARSLVNVDTSHQSAYLETPNPRTIPLYERHGFATIGHAQAGSCPPITLMHRSAR